jgi:hypothetical protein
MRWAGHVARVWKKEWPHKLIQLAEGIKRQTKIEQEEERGKGKVMVINKKIT